MLYGDFITGLQPARRFVSSDPPRQNHICYISEHVSARNDAEGIIVFFR